ncbi:GTPase HflX [Spirochaetota bacterium]
MESKSATIIGYFRTTREKQNEERSLDELAGLIGTLSIEANSRILVKNVRINAATFFSKGHLENIQHKLAQNHCRTVIFNFDLSPVQINKLSDILKRQVLSRTDIIIQIFSHHARTMEAKLQVQLAELTLEASRLKGKWKHFSRIEGGIGFRGPGEKQIQVDRTLLKKEIGKLKKKISQIQLQRDVQSKRRRDEKNIAIVGYTNSGKSTLLRSLSGKEIVCEDNLFTTLDVISKRIYINGVNFIFSDTVGFIDRLPHYLVASFHSTLKEIACADMILIIVDIANPGIEKNIETVKETLRTIGASKEKYFYVFNKIDLVPQSEQVLWRRIKPCAFISAKKKVSLDVLKERIAAYFKHGT